MLNEKWIANLQISITYTEFFEPHKNVLILLLG